VVAPEVAEEHERAALERAERRASASTRLRIQRRGDGSSDLRARIPDQVAARLKTYLDAYTSPRVDGARKGTGIVDPATGERLPYERLLGEAFCSLLESIDPQQMPLHAGSPTTVVATIDAAKLRAALGPAVMADGTRISVDQLRRQACNAGIIPAVLGGRSQVLDLGRRSRLFTGAQKLALAIEHPTCRAQGCTVPATWCEAHHGNNPWSQGGSTDLADGVLLCSWHHPSRRAQNALLRDRHRVRRHVIFGELHASYARDDRRQPPDRNRTCVQPRRPVLLWTTSGPLRPVGDRAETCSTTEARSAQHRGHDPDQWRRPRWLNVR
jgi:Domain of unknown function (DUF222)